MSQTLAVTLNIVINMYVWLGFRELLQVEDTGFREML
jgi:hypothetical protein